MPLTAYQWLLAYLGVWLHLCNFCLHLHIAFSFVHVSNPLLPVSYMDICEGHLELTWKIQANLPPLMDLNLIIFIMIYFSNKVNICSLQVLGPHILGEGGIILATTAIV